MKPFVLVLAAASTLAGCLAAPAPTEPLAVPALPALSAGVPAAPLRLLFEGCGEQAAVFAAPVSYFEGIAPEGFQVVTLDPAGHLAAVFVTGYACKVASAAEDEREDVREFSGMLMVIPPEEYRAEEEGVFYGIAFGIATTSAKAAEAYAAWGMPQVLGDVMWEMLADAPVARAGHVLGPDLENNTIHLYTSVQGPPMQGAAGKARLFAVGEGEVTAAMDVVWTAAPMAVERGEAVLRFDAMPAPEVVPTPIAFHAWGDTYGLEAVPVLFEEDAEDSDVAAPRWDLLRAARPAPGGIEVPFRLPLR